MRTPGRRIVALITGLAVFNLFFTITAQAAWSPTGSMNTARYGQTATLLPNGKVLVAGGGYNMGFFSTAELFDPASGKWTSTSSMAENRALHTATLLPNGKVLVVGGLTSSGIFNHSNSGAELYDPVAQLWAPTGPVRDSRYSHTATLLLDGRVLVTGGISNGTVVQTAELYDPASGQWTSAGFMGTARSQHTATLLPNGNVLVAGGIGLASAELFDPLNGTWTATGSMKSARRLFRATLLLNGKVLVTGGLDGGNSAQSGADLYDPATGNWTSVDGMSVARSSHSATLLPDGKVLVAGGSGATSTFISSSEIFNPTKGKWSANDNMSVAHGEHTATLLPSGNVLLAGGRNRIGNSVESTATVEIYSRAAATVTLGNLLQTYDGSAKSVSVATTPPGLNVDVTYNGSTSLPTNAGAYVVIATIDAQNFQGGASNILVITKAVGTVTLGNLVQAYDGVEKTVTASTVPPNLAVEVTYDGSAVAPINVGSYVVIGTINDINYAGSDTNTLHIGARPVILNQPMSRTNNIGTVASFEVLADGTPPLNYQWRKDGTNFIGTNGPVLTLTNVQKSDEGFYSVEIVSPYGTATSMDARLKVNRPPVADASATKTVLISPDGTNASILLDGTRSSDLDGDALVYTWYEGGNQLASGATATVLLPLGIHALQLVVSDGFATSSNGLTLEVITADEAIRRLIASVDGAVPHSHPLVVTLSAAQDSIKRGNKSAAIGQLQAFENKVLAQAQPIDPVLAEHLIESAEEIIDALSGLTPKLHHQPRAISNITPRPDGHIQLQFSATSGAINFVQASTNLADWETIRVIGQNADGSFSFEDANATKFPGRFYRIVSP